MSLLAPAFHRYVDRAREGRLGLGWLLLGLVLIALLVTLVSFAAVAIAIVQLGAGLMTPDAAARTVIQDFFATPPGMAVLLMSFVGMWLGVWLAVRPLQRRPFSGVLGADGRVSGGDFARGAAAAILTSGLSAFVALLFDPAIARGDVGTLTWLGWLVPLALLILLQSSAEEVLFRGYLLQSLAARWHWPLIWAVVPVLLFTALHTRVQDGVALNLAAHLGIAAVAGSAVLLVCRTGNLGAAMGLHWGANLVAILFLSQADWLRGAALFVGRSSAWDTRKLMAYIALDLVGTAAALWLLLARRSPLRLG